MAIILGVVNETFPGERRVAITPHVVPLLEKLGVEVRVESGAGLAAGFTDDAYRKAGATVLDDRSSVISRAEILAQVRTLGANPQHGVSDLGHFSSGTTVIGLSEPLTAVEPLQQLASTGVQTFALELIPRITRAQSMDVLSSQATVAGYAAVLIGANALPKMFPMMMTAAGTITAARAFIIGAGVAGLQAIATSRRLGAVVRGYDIRPAVKEQVESLGATFVEMELETGGSEDKGGYAKAMDDAFYRRQRELMTEVVRESDVVITTAAIPGKKSPILITEEMVKQMPAGSVIVDLAAERGGNCELTRADESIRAHDVIIIGATNLPSNMPYHASQMFAKNVTTLLKHLVKDGALHIDLADEITDATLLTREGEVVQRRVRELFGLPELQPAVAASSEEDHNV